MNKTFVQLTPDDCIYLLTLIAEMDDKTTYTERQRGYTVPKLQKIKNAPDSARLAYQDVDYLLELIEDDDVVEFEQARAMAQAQLIEIQKLQNARFEENKNIEEQRHARKLRRRPLTTEDLQEHFAKVKI